MKHFKTIRILVLIMTIMTLALSAEDQQKKAALGDNVLVYKVQYVNCMDLARLLGNYLDRSQGMQYDCIESLNSVVIKAPKDSHPILMKLIEEFDKKPIEVDLNISITTRSPIKSEVLKNSKPYYDDSKKAWVGQISTYSEAIYQGYGDFNIPLTSGKKIDSPTIWTFSFTKDSVTYKLLINIYRISITNNIITLRNFSVQLVTESGKHEELLSHSFDIDATSNKLTIIDTANKIFGENSPETLLICFRPKIIKD